MKAWYLIRSATAPDTIVAAVPANTSWKKNFAHSGTLVQLIAPYCPWYWSPMAGLLSAPPTIQAPEFPIQPPLSAPNIRSQPMSQKPMTVAANTTKFFERMLTQFLARAKPDSTQPKPRFMKNTSIPQTSTQTVSAASQRFFTICAASGTGIAGAAAAGAAAASVAAWAKASSDPVAASATAITRGSNASQRAAPAARAGLGTGIPRHGELQGGNGVAGKEDDRIMRLQKERTNRPGMPPQHRSARVSGNRLPTRRSQMANRVPCRQAGRTAREVADT